MQFLTRPQGAHTLALVDLTGGFQHHHVAQVRMVTNRGQRLAHFEPVVTLHRRSHQVGQHPTYASRARDQGRTRHPFLLNQEVPGEANGDEGNHQCERQDQLCAQRQWAHGLND